MVQSVAATGIHAEPIHLKSYPDWLMTGALSSPLLMLGVWIFREWWDSSKGDKKKLVEDIERLQNSLSRIEGMVGEDLDEKIDRRIESAFRYYEKGRLE